MVLCFKYHLKMGAYVNAVGWTWQKGETESQENDGEENVGRAGIGNTGAVTLSVCRVVTEMTCLGVWRF